MSLTFDEATHTYRWNGEKVPSVTQVLDVITDLDTIRRMRPGVIEYAADRGDAVHYGCELYDKGILDWDSVQPELRPYVEGWIKFIKDTGFEVDLIEHRVFHPALLYAGTCDRTGRLFDKKTMLDIKTVAVMYPSTGPQTAAYCHALEAEDREAPKFEQRCSVQLKADGSYRLHTYEDRTDWSVFVSALTLRNWAIRNQQRIHYEPA